MVIIGDCWEMMIMLLDFLVLLGFEPSKTRILISKRWQVPYGKLALGVGLPEGPKDVEITILDIANWKSSINEGLNNGSIIYLEIFPCHF